MVENVKPNKSDKILYMLVATIIGKVINEIEMEKNLKLDLKRPLGLQKPLRAWKDP